MGVTVRLNKRKRRESENRQPGGKTPIETKEERKILEIEKNEEVSSKSKVKKISWEDTWQKAKENKEDMSRKVTSNTMKSGRKI